MLSFFKKQNQAGNIIVFALSAIAVMSLSAIALTTATVLELKKSSNVEQATFANYNAESGLEHASFLINGALNAGRNLTEIKNILGLSSYQNGEIDCQTSIINNCENLIINLGASSIPVNFEQNDSVVINVFSLEDKNSPPFGDDAYNADSLKIDWDSGAREFEITFILWKVPNVGQVELLPVVTRRTEGNGLVIFNFQNEICNNPLSQAERDLCSAATGNFVIGQEILGKIRIRLLSASPIEAGRIYLLSSGSPEPLVDFIEIKSTGLFGSNKQAIRVIERISTPENQIESSSIWDYVLFTEEVLTK